MCKNVAPPANFLLKSDNHQVRQQEKINRFRSQSKSLPVQIQLKSDLKANFKKGERHEWIRADCRQFHSAPRRFAIASRHALPHLDSHFWRFFIAGFSELTISLTQIRDSKIFDIDLKDDLLVCSPGQIRIGPQTLHNSNFRWNSRNEVLPAFNKPGAFLKILDVGRHEISRIPILPTAPKTPLEPNIVRNGDFPLSFDNWIIDESGTAHM